MTGKVHPIRLYTVVGSSCLIIIGFLWFKQTGFPTGSVDLHAATAVTSQKTDCSGLRAAIEQNIVAYNASQHLIWKPGGATYEAGNYINREALYQLFYSPGLHTCIKVEEDQTLVQHHGRLVVYEDSYDFMDASTGELVDWVYATKHGSPYDSMGDVMHKIAQYESATSSPVTVDVP